MSWARPDAALCAAFDAALPAAAERRRMFGCPCAFVGGNLFAGVHEDKLILRLPQAAREALIAAGRAGPFVAQGRTMREYVAVAGAATLPAGQWREWLAQACAWTATLPAKAPRSVARPARQRTAR